MPNWTEAEVEILKEIVLEQGKDHDWDKIVKDLYERTNIRRTVIAAKTKYYSLRVDVHTRVQFRPPVPQVRLLSDTDEILFDLAFE
jgi:hypothetical protein